MMAKHIGWSMALTSAAMVLATAGPAQARPVYMKLGDIKGESATDRDHSGWIEILSMRLAPEPASPTASSGGVQVATGDVNGDGAADRKDPRHGSDASAGKGTERAAGVGGGAMPSVKGAIAAPEPVPAGLLLPAIQKIREAKARVSLSSCTPGQRLPPVAVRNSADGKTGRILDATLTACAADEVSFTFQKIEWD
jgi:hypothetical protein